MRFGKMLFASVAFAVSSLSVMAQGPFKGTTPGQIVGGQVKMVEMEVTGLAEAMPADKYVFAPTAEIFATGQKTEFNTVRTFGAQVAHIASANYEFLEMMGVKTGKDLKAIEGLTNKTEALQALKESFAAVQKEIAAMTPANAYELVGPKKETTRVAALGGVAWHTMDHYGQMVVYGRMNGVVPPASR